MDDDNNVSEACADGKNLSRKVYPMKDTEDGGMSATVRKQVNSPMRKKELQGLNWYGERSKRDDYGQVFDRYGCRVEHSQHFFHTSTMVDQREASNTD